VPLTMELRSASDSGTPVVARDPDGTLGRLYTEMAQSVWSTVSETPEPLANTSRQGT
jgi:ATP-binding protein involved in chromosome partitioning